MRVLITGGSGFIGSHLAESYLADGHQVTVLDNFSTGSKKNLTNIESQIELISGDIRDAQLVEGAMQNVDLVLHFAAALGVKNIMDNPIEAISTNIQGSEVVLKAAAMLKKRIVIASTSEIYGKNPNQPLSEESDRVVGKPQNYRWSYSDAKAIEESIAHILFQKEQLAVTTVRLFNTVGPRQTGKYGMVIPRFVEAAKKNEPLIVHGDGSQTRVFCHVDDAVKVIKLLAGSKESIGEVYNIGGVEEISINELAQKVISLTNSKSTIEYKPYADVYGKDFEDMQRRVPDIKKVTNQIGWSPSKGIEKIIKDVAASN